MHQYIAGSLIFTSGLCSLNYWRKPGPGPRRDADYILATLALFLLATAQFFCPAFLALCVRFVLSAEASGAVDLATFVAWVLLYALVVAGCWVIYQWPLRTVAAHFGLRLTSSLVLLFAKHAHVVQREELISAREELRDSKELLFGALPDLVQLRKTGSPKAQEMAAAGI